MKEQCLYLPKRSFPECRKCDGYNPKGGCVHYTTIEHIEEFFEIGNLGEVGRLEDLEDGGGFDNSHRWGV